MLHYN